MPVRSSQVHSSHRLTVLYITSLSAIALFSILGQVLVQHMLRRQAQDNQIISLAQHQQQLSQRLSKNILAVGFAPNPEVKQEQATALQQTIVAWQTSRERLAQIATQPNQPQRWKQQIAKMLMLIDSCSDDLLVASQMSLNALSPTPQQRLSRLVTVRQLLATEKHFVHEMDRVIEQSIAQSQQGINQLKSIEMGLLSLTILMLLTEGFFIFRPAVRQIQQSLDALATSLQETQATAQQLAIEQEKSERLLLNILPEPIAHRLKQETTAIADGFNEATVLFADIVGFTQLSAHLPPEKLVALLNTIFSSFDELAAEHGLEKIKTIGDAYMVVGGLPEPNPDHAKQVAEMAIAMLGAIEQFNREHQQDFSIRIGINSGPVVAGVIGIKKFIYDLWGDTVNIASRMESHGIPDQIQVSEATYQALKDQFDFTERGLIPVKGKGEMKTYLLHSKRHTAVTA